MFKVHNQRVFLLQFPRLCDVVMNDDASHPPLDSNPLIDLLSLDVVHALLLPVVDFALLLGRLGLSIAFSQ
jgi:hypothetical protein